MVNVRLFLSELNRLCLCLCLCLRSILVLSNGETHHPNKTNPNDLPFPMSLATAVSSAAATVLLLLLLVADAPATGSTLAVISSSPATVCGVAASNSVHSVRCYFAETGQTIPLFPNVSFSAVSGDRAALCGLLSGGHSLLCWDNLSDRYPMNNRIYHNVSTPLESLAIGDDQICAIVARLRTVKCWRVDKSTSLPPKIDQFVSISSGFGFSCGILLNEHQVRCWAREPIASML
ncbi:hypothetical protein CDL15_Pgr022529 [Punica granatum]|uniref:non-specific serine/threonine protein kinase n=1 Tax=Punica granatum TaxID=22663 RepID=A0A218XRJ0_PUNGR|nr:hypothetical protein CDL15_Pgr022529 [Punica granatum]